MLIVAGFWAQLWPAVVATFVGVVAGLPIALSINRYGTGVSRRADEKKRQEALSRATSAVLESLRWNAEKAGQHATMLEKNVAFWDSPLEVARWEAVREEFIGNAHDPILQSDVAFFFSNVRLNAGRIPLLFEFTHGPSSTGAKAAEVSDRMAEWLVESLRDLEADARVLDAKLQKFVIRRIPSTVPDS